VGVETHLFRNGGVRIVGLLTNPFLRVDDLGPAEFRSNERFEKTRSVKLTLPQEMYVYDLRAAKALGRRKEIAVTLDPYEPAIFAASAAPLAEMRVAAPARLGRGENGQIAVSFATRSPAATHLLHVDVVDPLGKISPCYSGNLLAGSGRTAKLLPLAVNDAAGKWEIRVKDLLSGQSATAAIEVF